MAKKKITGQSKLSKLQVSQIQDESNTEKLNLVSKSIRITPTSFRLTPEDKQRLKSVTESVNNLSPNKKISETMIIKALIQNGTKMKPEKLLEAIREVII